MEHIKFETSCVSVTKDDVNILETFAAKYTSIAKVDLCSGEAVVLRSVMDTGAVGKTFSWELLVERYAQYRTFPEDRKLVRSLTLERLAAFFDGAEAILPFEVRCLKDTDEHDWVRVSGDIVTGEDRQLLITTQLINEEHLMRKIIELFVYKNYDYFILLDAKKNSYTTFSNAQGKPLPPVKGDDYEAEVRRYNQKYLDEEISDDVTEKMMISHVIQMLEISDPYSFSTTSSTESGNCRHTRSSYSYYDKSAGLILLTRMDTTQVYLEEQERARELSSALHEMQLDPMTGLYNKKAMCQLANDLLIQQYEMEAAFLFVDIDNFKLVNDTLGHQKGDDLICYLARVLMHARGKDGIAGRIGGDEFLLLLPRIQNLSDVRQCAERLCLALTSNSRIDIGDLPISCSVGISIYPRDGISYNTLLHKADQALYNSKRYGKCQCSFYSLEV